MKALKIARTVAVWLVVALAVFMMVFTVISVSTFDRADRKLFGYRAFAVLTDSMEKTDFAPPATWCSSRMSIRKR